MQVLPNAHRWMTLPFFIAIAGFWFSYWSVFSTVPFHQHLHGLTATLWFLLVIIQPWLIWRGSLKLHRKLGFIGLFGAGGVVFSALQIVTNNLSNESLSPVLRYGLTWGDFLFLAGFAHAVIMGVLNSKNTPVHARYMIASAFWALLPALSRLIYFPLVIVFGFPPPLSFINVIHVSVGLSLGVLAFLIIRDYRTDGRVYASYVLVAAGTLWFGLTVRYMGEATWWISFCDSLL